MTPELFDRWQAKDDAEDRLRVTNYKLNDPQNTPASYTIKWPDGAFWIDLGTGREEDGRRKPTPE